MAEDKTKKTNGSDEKKGAHPPRLNLAEAGNIITELYERTGSEASLDDLSEIFGNSLKSSAFITKQNVLKKYGLIVFEADTAKLTDTAESIVAPKDKTEKAAALRKAFLEVEAFETVYQKYVGKLLPEDTFLINSFTAVGGRDKAEKWMESFKESARYAGLLMDRGDGKFQVREVGRALVEAESEKESSNNNKAVELPVNFESTNVQVIGKSNYQFLIDILNSDMSTEEQAAVWTLIQYLKKKEAASGGTGTRGENGD